MTEKRNAEEKRANASPKKPGRAADQFGSALIVVEVTCAIISIAYLAASCG